MTSFTPDDSKSQPSVAAPPAASPAPVSAAKDAHFNTSKRSSLSTPRRVKVVFDRAQFTQEHLNVVHTCPQCGVAPSSPKVKKRAFVYYPKLLLLLIPIGWIFVFLAYLITRQVIELRLPLCEGCNQRDRRSRAIRSMAVLSVLFLPLFTFIATILLNITGALSAGIVASSFFAGIAASILTTWRTKDDVFEPKRITKAQVFVDVPESWPRILRDQAPDVKHRVCVK